MSRFSTTRFPSPRLFILLLIPAALALAGCLDDDSSESVSARGTVTYVNLEGGFHGIVGSDGTHWDPDNLPEKYAVDGLSVEFRGVTASGNTFHMWGRSVHITHIEALPVQPEIDLEPFRALARASDCADRANRLFVIDDRLVFWDRTSRCADAAYARVLYARTVSRVICDLHDSIAGPQRACKEPGDDVALFDIIIANLEAPDLGLGSGHTVKRVDF